jgi:hypothetical protein
VPLNKIGIYHFNEGLKEIFLNLRYHLQLSMLFFYF